MTPIPLFVELCAGTAALSLRLHKPKARPPVSRMGSKAGYAEPILRALGLAPGQGAERYLWAEADPGVRLLLAAYTDRALAQGAAEVIRGWAGEEPRALWERLRAEGPCRGGPAVDAREVARMTALWEWSFRRGQPESGWCSVRVPFGGQPGQEGDRVPCRSMARRIGDTPTLPGVVAPDVGAVDPYEVARWLRIVSGNRLVNMGADWMNTGCGGTRWGGEFATDHEALLRAVEGVEEVPGVVVGRADFEPPRLPAGTVVIIDPDYVGTTGYGFSLPRPEVVRVAKAWRKAGARVGVCEQVAIPELVADGWCSVDITGLRVGQKRTFSKQQTEIVTLSEAAPAGWASGGQVGLFGGY